MGDLTLDRAEKLLSAAREVLEGGHVVGIAGLSYQAVEAAAAHLIKIVNGREPGGHAKRISRATDLLHLCKDELDRLWNARNVDFYGNEFVGEPERRITASEAMESLEIAERLVLQVKRLTKEGNGQ